MRQDLIKLIEAHEEITNAIILTHNIDFVFLQMIVLPAMRKCGRPTLTVFADSLCAAESYSRQSPVLSTLGTRYRVVPVPMDPGFRFHPKALFLSGSKKATLLVGSGNLTFGGWKENAEVWVRFDSQEDTTAPFSFFRSYLQDIVKRIPIAEPVQSEIEEAFDGQSHEWARVMDPPAGLIGRVGKGPSMLEQIKLIAEPGPTDEITICSPYYDSEGEALDRLFSEFRPKKKRVLVQQRYPGLPRVAAAKIQEPGAIMPVGFTRTTEEGHPRESFIHAKFYGIHRDEFVSVFAGSANCSRAALTLDGPRGNAELVAIQRLTPDEFVSAYLSEMPPAEKELVLPEISTDTTEYVLEPIQILAARYDNGILRIAFTSASDATITGCLVDETKLDLISEDHGIGWVELSTPPLKTCLIGSLNGEIIHSRETWIDIERDLRTTASGRSVANTIIESVRSGQWNIGAWQKVLEVFGKHLQYMPARASGFSHRTKKDSSKQPVQFTADDVFSDTYGLPNFASGLHAGIVEDRIQDLQQILLRWFGVIDRDDLKGEENQQTTIDEGGDGEGDKPEKFPKIQSKIIVQKPTTDADRKRAKKSLQILTEAMSNADFLSKRPPGSLATDLKIAAVLLRTALQEQWIDDVAFFNATWRIWSPLFFSSPGNTHQGWVERRYIEAEDREDFLVHMSSPELAAALGAWSMAVIPVGSDPENARFVLAQALAIARLPWIWRSGSSERIGQELARMLFSTGKAPSDDEMRKIEQEWVSIIRTGEAFHALEESLKSCSATELRKTITQADVSRGELLWQGKCGYCVALKNCSRTVPESVHVLRLQDAEEDRPFQSPYLVPVSSRKLSMILRHLYFEFSVVSVCFARLI